MTENDLHNIINNAWDNIASINSTDTDIVRAVNETIEKLDSGSIRVAEKSNNEWIVNEWIKKAVLISFRINDNKVLKGPYTSWFDKVEGKTVNWGQEDWNKAGYRHVPNGTVRKGSFIGKGVVLMPSFVNIGAFIDEGTMVDTWATVGSCAQIGKHVHLSGGVGIGGVLEPLQATPTIIEDNCFIGARSEIVEGVIVEKGSVISMGVYIGKSTRIFDRTTGEVSYGVVPAGSVVVSGNLPSKDGKYSMYAAIIVKKVDEKTLSKVGINNILRDLD